MKIGLIIGIVIGVMVILGILAFVFMGNNSLKGNSPSVPSQTPSSISTPSQISSPNSASKIENIVINNFAFSPSSFTIKKGDTIIWTNMDSASHTVVSDSGNEISSGSISKGKTYSHTFDNIGTFSYHCSIHPSMKGTIVVQ